MSVNKKDIWAAAGATLVVATVVVLGFLTLGSPGKQRLISADNRRLTDIAQLAFRVNQRWDTTNHHFPATLDEVSPSAPKDPITAAPYKYHVISPNQYELCATFAYAIPHDEQTQFPMWAHPAGPYCFKIDPSQSWQAFYAP